MRKIAIIASLVVIVFAGVFVWLLAGAGPENAPDDVRTIDVTPAL